MIKLIIGGKGSGKTKTLIELVNNAAVTTKGSVVCIEKGDKLNLDIIHKARLIDTDYYAIRDAEALYGFIAGILASNSDITDIFVDSTLKICALDLAAFEAILPKIEAITKDVNVVMTLSVPVEECSDAIKAFA
jgi:thymidine kinase